VKDSSLLHDDLLLSCDFAEGQLHRGEAGTVPDLNLELGI
jgi:hypothetical protein